MAFTERDPKSGIYYVGFRFSGAKYKRSVHTKSAKEAEAVRSRVEETLRMIRIGRVAVPSGADLVTFVMSDGVLQKPVEAPRVLTLGELFKRFCDDPPTDTKDAETLSHDMFRTKHYGAIFGKGTPVTDLSTERLQQYVNTRSKQKTKAGKVVSQVTVRNEIQSLLGIWNRWALPHGLVTQRLSAKGIVYPKTRTKPPFQTFEQIERQIARGVTADEEGELWGSLFLTLSEIDELLTRVREVGPTWLHLFVAMAAHTGARRGELLRSQVQDVDMGAGIIRIREKKKDRSKDFTLRNVPMSTYLRGEMSAWLAVHPGGHFLICIKANTAVTGGQFRYYFEVATKGTKFEHMGASAHVLRHSFCSNCAAKGIDPRMIDEWTGHTTEEMRRRYRHVFPQASVAALSSVFG